MMIVNFLINLTFSSSFASEEPVSIPTLVKNNAKEAPNAPAMKTKDPKTGEEVSSSTYDIIR